MKRSHLLRIVIPFALGYFTSYLFRSVNAVLAPKLTADLALSAADLGLLTSMYFLSFAAMQIPLGIWLDRYRAHKIEAMLLTVAAAGALTFAIADSLLGLAVGRFLIGIGVSACLMAAFRAFTDWFKPNELTRMNGIQLASGGLGALFATEPTAWLANILGWRAVFVLLAVVTLFIAILLWRVVPESQQGRQKAQQPLGFIDIFCSPAFIAIAPLTALVQASYISLLGLWAHPWLQYVSAMSEHRATNTLFWAAAAMTISFIIWGQLSTWLEKKSIAPINTAFCGMALYIVTFACIVAKPSYMPTFVWVLLALLAGSSPINYAVLSRSFPAGVGGRVITALNLLTFVLSFLIQWVMGVVINLFPTASAGIYPPSAYKQAFVILLALIVLSLLWYVVRIRRIEMVAQA